MLKFCHISAFQYCTGNFFGTDLGKTKFKKEKLICLAHALVVPLRYTRLPVKEQRPVHHQNQSPTRNYEMRRYIESDPGIAETESPVHSQTRCLRAAGFAMSCWIAFPESQLRIVKSHRLSYCHPARDHSKQKIFLNIILESKIRCCKESLEKLPQGCS